MEISNELLTILLEVDEYGDIGKPKEAVTKKISNSDTWCNTLEQFEIYNLEDFKPCESGTLL